MGVLCISCPLIIQILDLPSKQEYCFLTAWQSHLLLRKLRRIHHENHPWLQSPWLYPRCSIFCWSGFRHQRLRTSKHSYLVDLNSKTVTDIGTLGGAYSYAHGINDAGQVVGWSDTAGGVSPCFHHRPRRDGHERPWHLRCVLTAMLMASTTPGRWWVILTRLEALTYHAFITGPNGMGMRDLGTLGGSMLQRCFWHQRRRAGGGFV